ncbi:MAG: hypothetical protein ACOC2U_00265 [bacterium]
MLVKTNEKEKTTGRDIYENALTGERGTLDRHRATPSIRYEKRNKDRNKVNTNKSSTKGRRIYFQDIVDVKVIKTKRKKLMRDFDGNIVLNKRTKKPRYHTVEIETPIVKRTSIKHIQETPAALERKSIYLETLDRIDINKSKWHKDHPEYQRKQ